jgi:hypothetical protein
MIAVSMINRTLAARDILQDRAKAKGIVIVKTAGS